MKHQSLEIWVILGLLISVGYILSPALVSGISNELSRSMDSKMSVEPEIGFCTYLGGSGEDGIYAITISDDGSIYLAGSTSSTDFPTTEGAYDRSHNGGPYWNEKDCFVTKLSSDGQEIIYSTFIGGSDDAECVHDITVDADGYVYITGYTSSSDFPTTEGAYDRTYNGGFSDCFVAKLSPDGSDLIYSTYVGGSEGEENTFRMMIDNIGNCYVIGYTESPDFPINTLNEQESCHTLGGEQDGFVFKLSANGSTLEFSMYLGGAGEFETANDLTIDSEGNIIVVGDTRSPDFPLVNALDDELTGASDGFITKLQPNGLILFSTFFGESDADGIKSLSISPSNRIVLTGRTSSEDFPRIGNTEQYLNGSTGIFLLIFDSLFTNIEFSCILINSEYEDTYTTVNSVKAISDQEMWFTGTTENEQFPVTENGLDTIMSRYKGYLTMIDPMCKTLNYSTFFGGSTRTTIISFTADSSSYIYACGTTDSSDLPVKDAIQPTKQGSEYYDGFVFSLIREETLGPLPILSILIIGTGVGILAVIVIMLKRSS